MKTPKSKSYETAKAALDGARTAQSGSDHYYRGGGCAGCDLCYVADGRGGATRIDIGPDGQNIRERHIPPRTLHAICPACGITTEHTPVTGAMLQCGWCGGYHTSVQIEAYAARLSKAE